MLLSSIQQLPCSICAELVSKTQPPPDEPVLIAGQGSSPVGPVWCMISSRGLAACHLTKQCPFTSQSISRSWPRSELRRDDRAIRSWCDRIFSANANEAVSGGPLPLHLRGTAFQLEVWRGLLAVRPGTTTTYRQLACRVGRPGAARAVGNAVGANPVARLIPCHRVVRESGALGGYRWGAACKQRLLKWEQAGLDLLVA